MKKSLIFAAGLLFAVSSNAQSSNAHPAGESVGDKAENAAKSAGEATGVNALVGAAPTTEDFVKSAAISGLFEIKSSRIALDRADPSTKAFARMMISDHQTIADELKQKVRAGAVQVAVPDRLDSSHEKMLNKLSKQSGKKFLKTYDKDQVDGHKETVSLFQRYAQGGDNAVLKEWAASTLPKLQSHLDAAQSLEKQMADAN